MNASTKFSCTVEDLKKALEVAGVKNPEIENVSDIASAITSLIARQRIADDIRPDEKRCKLVDLKVIIVVEGNTGTDDGKYLDSVKKLQKIIFDKEPDNSSHGTIY